MAIYAIHRSRHGYQDGREESQMNMRIFDGTTYRDMTPEEIAAWQQSISDTPAQEPTTEERIAALESSISSLKRSFSKFEDKLKRLNL